MQQIVFTYEDGAFAYIWIGHFKHILLMVDIHVLNSHTCGASNLPILI